MRRALAYASLLAFVACAIAAGLATGASSNVVVTVDIPSATTLVTTGCPPETTGVTNFGIVQPGSVAKTSVDCTVSFGSSNDSASLRMAQSDGIGSAMAHPTDLWTRHTGSSHLYYAVDIDPTYAVTWAAGANGTVRRSQDGGDTWSAQQTPGGSNHHAVSVPSASTAWLGADGGLDIYRTTTGTNATPTWGVAPVRSGIEVDGLVATSTTNVWVVGPDGAIRVTTDGGTTVGGWSSRSFTDLAGGPAASDDDLKGISALDSNSLAAYGPAGRIVATSDGTTWRDISLPVGIAVEDVEVISDTTMVAVGSLGRIYTTSNATNASPTWTERYDQGFITVLSVDFHDASTGVAVGQEGTLLRTGDGGLTWSTETVDTSIHMYGVHYTSATGLGLVAVGQGSSAVRSSDGGANWQTELAGQAQFEGVSATFGGTVWRVGSDGTIEKSTTGGTSWSAQVSNTGSDLFGVRALSPTEAIAVGRDGTIVQTSNGGTTWNVRASGVAAELRAVDVFDSSAMVVARDGTILRSGDRGVTWSIARPAGGVTLTDIELVSATVAIASGASGSLHRSTDSGATWTTNAALPTGSSYVQTITADASSKHVFYQAGSTVARSTDEGLTWTSRGSATTSFNDLDTASATVLVGTSGGQIRRSVDAGATWTMMTGNQVTYHEPRALDVLDRNTTVIVGTGGLSGTTGVSGTVPDYAMNTSDWYDHGTEAFGACLRATTATPTWSPNATCDQAADGAHWRGVPTVADPTAEVASTASGDGTRTADFRFGLRVAPDEPPGELSAGITFVVIAPDA